MSTQQNFRKKAGAFVTLASLTLAACSSAGVKLDTEAANDKAAAEKTSNQLPVSMYDTSRAKTEDYSKVNENQAKYVFLFIGDGMGVTLVTAAENYLGFTKTNKGEVYPDLMNFTEMPVVGLKTQFDCHSFIPDSASTATAFASGIKTQTDTVGLSGDFTEAADTVAEKAKRAGKSVGILSTVTLNHATPAAFYANTESRNSYYDIGLQMAESGFDFFAGGSLKHRTDKGEDKKDLYAILQEKGYTIADTKEKAAAITSQSEKVYMVAEDLQDDGAMIYAIDQKPGDQTLKDMVDKGIEVLSDDPEGFFMMAESGKIDWAEHANDGVTTMEEVIQFQDAIQSAMDFYNEHPDDTLIVVTADHSTGGFTIGNASTKYETYFDLLTHQKGSQVAFKEKVDAALASNPAMTFEEFAPQITDFFGLKLDSNAGAENGPEAQVAAYQAQQEKDRMICSKEEYQALKVAFEESKKEKDDQNVQYGGYDPVSITATQIIDKKAGLAWTTTAHSGEKVPVYAMGSGAYMFDGEYDDTDVAIRIGEAMGLNGKVAGPKDQMETKTEKPSGVGLKPAQ